MSRVVRPWMRQELMLMRELESIMSSSSNPIRPSVRVEWNVPRNVKANKTEVIEEKDAFKPFTTQLYVKNFSPQDISVKAVNSNIIIEGKRNDTRCISRHFLRTIPLPKGYRAEDVVSKLSPDGMLTITAPRSTLE